VIDAADAATLAAGGVVVRDGFLGGAWAGLVYRVAHGFAESGALRAASTGKERTIEPDLRGDQVGWLDPGGPGLGTLFARFEALRAALNAASDLGLTRFEVQLARYAGGARYARHRDAFANDNQRVATAIYYLNPGWTPAAGGQLRLYTAEGTVDVEPILDRLVLFLAEKVEHEVLPANQPRLAITAWYRRY
jgi:SM-20-related protein